MERSGADVFGHALVDWVNGGTTPEMIERDDGYFETGAGPEVYLSGIRGWPSAERHAVRFARGRVLDVGCGAGRVALALQHRGVDVVGLDASPLAVIAATMRGVHEVWCLSLERLERQLESFDTIVLFGNNFGLFATPEGAQRRLSQWARHTKPGTRILAESTNAYVGGAPAMDRRYYRRNLERGNAPGQARFRYHYGGEVGSWFDWLFVSRTEMKEILHGTGWRMTQVIAKGSSEPYVAVLEKT
ncbi:MAG: methyltransferase domain-containing protein [Acidimicrobiales bacterium]